jgi:hypothetical protein
MRRLSSSSTFFYKRVFPAIWLGIVGIGITAGLFGHTGPFRQHVGERPPIDPMAVVIPIMMFVVGFVVFRRLLSGLADEVMLEGDTVIVKKGDEQLRIALTEVINVNSLNSVNPRRISLRLRNSTRLGRDIDFVPVGRRPMLFLGMTKLDPIAEELIDRIDALRRSNR